LINNALGPWTVSGPSRYITGLALQDKNWHQTNTVNLKQQSKKLKTLIERSLISDKNMANIKGTDLFQTLFCNNAIVIHESLAKNAVYTRLLDNRQGVRFALPEKAQWEKLEQVLESMSVK
jgi:cobalamin biosynthesis protein CobC